MSDILLKKMFSGDRLALSRLISMVENRSGDLVALMAQVQERCGQAHRIGITGPPGAGKSTLVDRLIAQFRQAGQRVGVIAIDPSSPFTGGAVLGDRIRMQDHASDEGVFIRSLGSRGSHGGLSRATREVSKLFDAFGFEVILIETVGVGQTELDIMELVDTTLVILTPESGDTIQTMKAGILEIADIFVVNKADRDGADRMQAELTVMLEIGRTHDQAWTVPVLATQAFHNIGIRELGDALTAHFTFIRKQGVNQAKRGLLFRSEVAEILSDEIKSQVNQWLETVQFDRNHNPYLVAQQALKEAPWLLQHASSRPSTPQRKSPSRSSSAPTRKKSRKR